MHRSLHGTFVLRRTTLRIKEIVRADPESGVDLIREHQQVAYLLDDIRYVTPLLCECLFLISSVVIRREAEQVVAVANTRLLEIAQEALGERARIPVIEIIEADEEGLRRLCQTDLVGKSVLFGIARPQHLGRLILRFSPQEWLQLFAGLGSLVKWARALRISRPTLFYGAGDNAPQVDEAEGKGGEDLDDHFGRDDTVVMSSSDKEDESGEGA